MLTFSRHCISGLVIIQYHKAPSDIMHRCMDNCIALLPSAPLNFFALTLHVISLWRLWHRCSQWLLLTVCTFCAIFTLKVSCSLITASFQIDTKLQSLQSYGPHEWSKRQQQGTNSPSHAIVHSMSDSKYIMRAHVLDYIEHTGGIRKDDDKFGQ